MINNGIPLRSEGIKVADRRIIREAEEQIKNEAFKITGVKKELTCELRRRKVEIRNMVSKNEVKQMVSSQNVQINRDMSYADKLKSLPDKQLKGKNFEPVYPVSVKSKQENISLDKIRKILADKIDPIKSKIIVKDLKETKSRGIIVNCADKADAEKLKLIIKANITELSAETIEKSRPRVAIRLDEKIQKEELYDIIFQQNEQIRDYCKDNIDTHKEEMKEKFRLGGRIRRISR